MIAVTSAVLALLSTWAAVTVFPAHPALLPIAVAGLLLANVGAWVHARPSFGRRRGLPPGSLGLGISLDAIAQPGFYARAASRWGPIFKMAQFHRPVVCITDLRLGLDVMEEHRVDLAQPRLAFGRLSPGNYIEFMNDEGHARYRAILQSALKGRVIEACRDGVAAAIRDQLRLAATNDVGRGVDPDPYLTRIGFSAMMRVMCGVPADDSQIDELHRWFMALGTMRTFTERRPEQRVEPYEHLVEWVRRRGTEVRNRIARGQHVEPSVMSEILRSDPAHLDDETILGNIVLIVHVTHSNLRGLLGWILKESLDHPEYAAELRRVAQTTPDATRVRALATRFVNETLRLHQSEYFYREVVRSFEFSGFRVPKGWLLRVCVREAHDDPTVFESPGTFDPGRFENRSYNRTEYCPFSDGAHSCFGAGLAVMIAMSFVSTLAVGFDITVVRDGPIVRDGNRHWSHWRPNPGLRISLVPRT
jgi:cytochrome P450